MIIRDYRAVGRPADRRMSSTERERWWNQLKTKAKEIAEKDGLDYESVLTMLVKGFGKD